MRTTAPLKSNTSKPAADSMPARQGMATDRQRVEARTTIEAAPAAGTVMLQTTRFGEVEVEAEAIIEMPAGILGFGHSRHFALIRPSDEATFFWLQSVDEPQLAFIVTDPMAYFPEYDVPLREETLDDLGLDGEPTAGQVAVLVTVNKTADPRTGEQWLTGNLMGPILVNTQGRRARQVVLTEKRWTTRQPLAKLDPA
jgi:flagellar assembly factor FliW